MLYISWNKWTCFMKYKGLFDQFLGKYCHFIYVFATLQRFLSPIQLLVNNELFHQSSFYLKNIILSFQLLFQQRYLHFSPGGKSGGKCPRPVMRMKKEKERWWSLRCSLPDAGNEFLESQGISPTSESEFWIGFAGLTAISVIFSCAAYVQLIRIKKLK